MTVTDKILNEWSFRCHDGIVDMNDPTKLSILDEVLNEYGLESFNEMKTSPTNKAIDAILSSPEAAGKLSYHSRPKRVKNIDNISNNSFIDIISNALDIDSKEFENIIRSKLTEDQLNENDFRDKCIKCFDAEKKQNHAMVRLKNKKMVRDIEQFLSTLSEEQLENFKKIVAQVVTDRKIKNLKKDFNITDFING